MNGEGTEDSGEEKQFREEMRMIERSARREKKGREGRVERGQKNSEGADRREKKRWGKSGEKREGGRKERRAREV